MTQSARAYRGMARAMPVTSDLHDAMRYGYHCANVRFTVGSGMVGIELSGASRARTARGRCHPDIPQQCEVAVANFVKAVTAAKSILEEFGFSAPPINPVTIARDMGVRVTFVELPAKHQNVSGFYDATDDAIYVNKDEYPKRKTFTIAHELGHRVLHREWAASNDYRVLLRDPSLIIDAREQEANAFAAHLLVPTKMLATYRHVASIEELSNLFVVSMPVIRNRLKREFHT